MDTEKNLNVDSVDSFKKQYEMLNTIIDSIESQIWASDREGNMILLNSSAQKGLGLDNAGKDVLEIVNELKIFETDGSELLTKNIPLFKVLKGETVRGEKIIPHLKTGELKLIGYMISPIKDENGGIIGSVSVSKDITDKKKVEQEFFSALSHELRNSLATIIMGLSLFEQVSMDKDEEQKIRRMIMRQAGQLSRLVDDLLDMTRIEQNRFELKKRFLELNRMIKHVSLDEQPLFNEKEILLETRIISEKIYVEGDPERLTQVIENLLRNALKFTPKGGRVTLILDKDSEAKKAIISVTDTGEGISAEQLGEVFKPFVRIGHSYDKNIAGLGIGLFVVKEIINKHGGEIEVLSEGLGKGAKFIIKLSLID